MSYVKQALCAQSYPLLKTQLRYRKLWNICHRLPVGDRKRDQGESYEFVSWCQQRGMEVVAAAGNGRLQPQTEYVWIECVEVCKTQEQRVFGGPCLRMQMHSR